MPAAEEFSTVATRTTTTTAATLGCCSRPLLPRCSTARPDALAVVRADHSLMLCKFWPWQSAAALSAGSIDPATYGLLQKATHIEACSGFFSLSSGCSRAPNTSASASFFCFLISVPCQDGLSGKALAEALLGAGDGVMLRIKHHVQDYRGHLPCACSAAAEGKKGMSRPGAFARLLIFTWLSRSRETTDP